MDNNNGRTLLDVYKIITGGLNKTPETTTPAVETPTPVPESTPTVTAPEPTVTPSTTPVSGGDGASIKFNAVADITNALKIVIKDLEEQYNLVNNSVAKKDSFWKGGAANNYFDKFTQHDKQDYLDTITKCNGILDEINRVAADIKTTENKIEGSITTKTVPSTPTKKTTTTGGTGGNSGGNKAKEKEKSPFDPTYKNPGASKDNKTDQGFTVKPKSDENLTNNVIPDPNRSKDEVPVFTTTDGTRPDPTATPNAMEGDPRYKNLTPNAMENDPRYKAPITMLNDAAKVNTAPKKPESINPVAGDSNPTDQGFTVKSKSPISPVMTNTSIGKNPGASKDNKTDQSFTVKPNAMKGDPRYENPNYNYYTSDKQKLSDTYNKMNKENPIHSFPNVASSAGNIRDRGFSSSMDGYKSDYDIMNDNINKLNRENKAQTSVKGNLKDSGYPSSLDRSGAGQVGSLVGNPSDRGFPSSTEGYKSNYDIMNDNIDKLNRENKVQTPINGNLRDAGYSSSMDGYNNSKTAATKQGYSTSMSGFGGDGVRLDKQPNAIKTYPNVASSSGNVRDRGFSSSMDGYKSDYDIMNDNINKLNRENKVQTPINGNLRDAGYSSSMDGMPKTKSAMRGDPRYENPNYNYYTSDKQKLSDTYNKMNKENPIQSFPNVASSAGNIRDRGFSSSMDGYKAPVSPLDSARAEADRLSKEKPILRSPLAEAATPKTITPVTTGSNNSILKTGSGSAHTSQSNIEVVAPKKTNTSTKSTTTTAKKTTTTTNAAVKPTTTTPKTTATNTSTKSTSTTAKKASTTKKSSSSAKKTTTKKTTTTKSNTSTKKATTKKATTTKTNTSTKKATTSSSTAKKTTYSNSSR